MFRSDDGVAASYKRYLILRRLQTNRNLLRLDIGDHLNAPPFVSYRTCPIADEEMAASGRLIPSLSPWVVSTHLMS